MVEARIFKFGKETDGGKLKRKKCKILSKGVMWGSLGLDVTWPNFRILGPPNISQMVEARNFKFGTETDGGQF